MTPNYWADPNCGIAYQVQVEIPQHELSSMKDVLKVPVMQNGAARPLLCLAGCLEQPDYSNPPYTITASWHTPQLSQEGTVETIRIFTGARVVGVEGMSALHGN